MQPLPSEPSPHKLKSQLRPRKKPPLVDGQYTRRDLKVVRDSIREISERLRQVAGGSGISLAKVWELTNATRAELSRFHSKTAATPKFPHNKKRRPGNRGHKKRYH